MAMLAERTRLTDVARRASIELFKRRVDNGQVLKLQNAAHHIFPSNQQQVLEAVESFAAKVRISESSDNVLGGPVNP